jgi:isovaleryl-CoA dehydrogenase
MSEADAGSDIGAMRTAAKRDGNQWVVNGQKLWATGAAAKNNVINMYVKTDPAAHYRQGMSLILIDNTTPGLEMRKLDMLGRRCVGTYEIFLTDVRVPGDRIVGGENKGWDVVLAGLQIERVTAAAGSCGAAQAIVDLAISYAKERKQFGKPIGTFQLMQGKIADMYVALNSARAYVYAVAKACDAGRTTRFDAAGAILLASENAVKTSLEAIQALGGAGYTKDYPVERLLRDAKLYDIGAGTNEIRRFLIGRELVGEG